MKQRELVNLLLISMILSAIDGPTITWVHSSSRLALCLIHQVKMVFLNNSKGSSLKVTVFSTFSHA